ncbi:GNAT family N-acetyltransferase [Lacticaseibacillus paracasei]|uniref:GNAT family N-acetyltransferase n=1 Tax=Lacticaseibacillus paracasei TaxID=1597 RepID=UPI0021A4B230|nr:N-acetyltransferase [Lacticaseibacillus paracasei]MCT2893451.1 N-acetyltransferase [Lacticaseibacillus paracasei]
MKTTIRPEQPSDYRQVETIHRNAFWNLYVPGADEHFLAHIIRDHTDFVPELDLVLEHNAQVIGNIMYTKAKLVDENGNEKTILTFGPVAIDPAFQRQGFGKQLMEVSMKRAAELGYDTIVILGDPDNYVERGFKSCQKFNVWAADNTQPTAMIVKVIKPNALDGRKWTYHESPAMSYDKEDATRFDTTFPAKAKGYQASQEAFYILSHSVLKS